MNYYERHLGDYAKDTSHLTMIEHGAYSLLLDRYYSTEQGIPADQAYRVARAHTTGEKRAVDVVLTEFFQLVDGAWINRRAEEEINKTKAKINAAKENGRKGGRPKGKKFCSENETQQKPTGLFMGSENETQQKAHQTPYTRHHTPDKSSNTHTSTDSHESACVSSLPTEPAIPTESGIVCLAMRQAGIADANPSHPTLLALIEAGATPTEFSFAARDAVSKGKGFAYVVGTVKRRREDAAKLVLHQGKLPNKQEALEASNRAVGLEWEQKMREQMVTEVSYAG